VLTIGLLAVCGEVFKHAGIDLFVPMIVGTSVWAGIDSAKVHLIRYQSGICHGPMVLGIFCSMFWPVGFPWYLVVRYKIQTGKARLRPEYEHWDMANGKTGPTGLVQPWQGRSL
jgi:hypothetical protein